MTDPVFFSPARTYLLSEVAELTGAILSVASRGSDVIESVAPAPDARCGQICFIDGRGAAKRIAELRASAVFCTEDVVQFAPDTCATLVTPKPQRAFALFMRQMYPDAEFPQPLIGDGVSPAAHIAADAQIESGAVIEAGAVVGSKASIGAGTVISANAVIGKGCQIGRNSYVGFGASVQAALIGDRVIIHAGVRIGSDGFGFVAGPSGLEKMPQIGRVIIQDKVEIGANSTIDRGAMSDTVIGEGTKIDNLVQIGHGVTIGRSCAIAGATGIGGSSKIGDFVMIGGGTGIADHVTIGDGVMLSGASALMHDIPAGERWAGYPAQPVKSWVRRDLLLRELGKSKGKV